MGNDRKWTVDDVQRLVEAATVVATMLKEGRYIYKSTGKASALIDALKPFEPDPDADLIASVKSIRTDCCSCPDCEPDSVDREIISFIRDHDAKAVAK